jgi:hypothetical protein
VRIAILRIPHKQSRALTVDFVRSCQDGATRGTKQTLRPSRLLRHTRHAIARAAGDVVGAWMLSRDTARVGEARLYYTQLPARKLAVIHKRAVELALPEEAQRALLGPGNTAVPVALPDLGALPADTSERAAAVVRDWQTDVLALIREEGAGKRTRARLAATDFPAFSQRRS